MDPNLQKTPIQPIPSSIPDRHLNLLPVIIVGIVMLLLGLGGGYLLFANKNQVKQSETIQASPTVTQQVNPTNSVSPTIDPTANWKTYINTQYGIFFKYPSDWKTTTPFNFKSSPDQNLNLGLIPTNKTQGSTTTPIYFLQYDNPNNLSFANWDKKENEDVPSQDYLNTSDTKNYPLHGLTAYVNEKGSCEPVFCEEVIVMGKNNVYVFRRPNFTDLGYTKEEIESFKPIFDQILSTFKFTQ